MIKMYMYMYVQNVHNVHKLHFCIYLESSFCGHELTTDILIYNTHQWFNGCALLKGDKLWISVPAGSNQ